MKKFFVRSLIALVVLLVVAVLTLGLSLDKIIKRGVEKFGPVVTQVSVKLASVNVSLFSGSGKVKGLVIGNPPGYQTPFAISVGQASLALKPGSLLSDKIIIKSINVQAPEITFETTLTANNLKQIEANVQQSTGPSQPSQPSQPNQPEQPRGVPGQTKPSRKLQVDEFVIEGGKIHVSIKGLQGHEASVPLPPIILTNLGAGPEGITPAELTKVVLQAIVHDTEQAAGGAATGLGKGAINLGSNTVGKATSAIGGLFKKKETP